MKNVLTSLFIILAFTLTMTQANAQSSPAPSPLGKAYQRLGVTDVEVAYSRPGVKGRKIFGDGGIVPYGQVWRTGANAATKITFSTPVMIGGAKLAAGSYSILTIPGATEWTVIFNTDPAANAGSYKQDKDAVRVKVAPVEFPFPVETLMFTFGEVKDTSAVLYFVWDRTSVAVPIEVEKTW